MHVWMSTRKSLNVKFSATYPMLDVLQSKAQSWYFFFCSQLYFRTEQSSYLKCTIFTASLIHYLQFPHCRLHRLVLFRCTLLILMTTPMQLITTLCTMDVALHSLDILSWSVLDQMMSCINPFTHHWLNWSYTCWQWYTYIYFSGGDNTSGDSF